MQSDESAVCAQIKAVAVSLSQSFVKDVVYALSQLRMQHLKLKETQQRAIEAICQGDDVFYSLHILSTLKTCIFTHPLERASGVAPLVLLGNRHE